MASDLRMSIVHRLQDAGINSGQEDDTAQEIAADVCEAMIREERERWGHVAGCICEHIAPDRRCAPQETPDAAPTAQNDPIWYRGPEEGDR